MELKSSKWMQLYLTSSDMQYGEFRIFIGSEYELDEAVVGMLICTYTSYVGGNGNTKVVVVTDDEVMIDKLVRIDASPSMDARKVKLEDFVLKGEINVGDTV